jgi:hypothetical protein
MDEASFCETYVATLLSRMGLYVLHHPTNIDHDGPAGHQHSVDLTVVRDIYNGEMEGAYDVEVKSTAWLSDSGTRLLCSERNFRAKHIKSRSGWRTFRDYLFLAKGRGSVTWLPSGSQVMLDSEAGLSVTDRTRNETYLAARFEAHLLRPLAEFIERVKSGAEF